MKSAFVKELKLGASQTTKMESYQQELAAFNRYFSSEICNLTEIFQFK